MLQCGAALFLMSDRRAGDCRDWPRPEIALDVREPGKKSRSCSGDLSPEGMFSIPVYVGPVAARAKVIGRAGAKGHAGVRRVH